MSRSRRTILIVDDDADFRESVAFFLKTHGYRVLKARDGREGLRLAKMERPDLILMDIMMDERTEGFFAVQELRRSEELKDVPIFVLSALYALAPDFGIAVERGWLAHDEFFSKPVDFEHLLDKIRVRLSAPAEAEL